MIETGRYATMTRGLLGVLLVLQLQQQQHVVATSSLIILPEIQRLALHGR